jgi:glutamyl-tRNA reductase
MSLIAVGVSHHTASVPMLERVALTGDAVPKLLTELDDAPALVESLVLSTCNRVEIYVEAGRFHAAVDTVTEALSRVTGVNHDELVPHLYVHFEDRAVQHLFTVASGLDSMVVGEAQILGQVRQALRTAQEQGSAGRALNELVQTALRVGKRAHTETDIDAAGASLVAVGLDLAAGSLGGLAGRTAVVVGAGSMASLSAQSLQRAGANLVVLNRTLERAQHLASSVGGRAGGLDDLQSALGEAELLVACTGALGHVVPASVVAQVQAGRDWRPLVLLDLALPRDVDPAALGVQGVTLVDLEDLSTVLDDADIDLDVEAARQIVSDEVDAFLDARHAARVEPTVIALRGRAADIVDGELRRLGGRLPDLDPQVRADVEQAMHRIVDKLLHAPTVRVKELAGSPDGDAYAQALRRLFDLDPRTVAAVETPEPADPDGGGRA